MIIIILFFVFQLIYGPFSKKLSKNGRDTLTKNISDSVNLNVMYVYRILWQASVFNSRAACYVLTLLETIIEKQFYLYRYGFNITVKTEH